MCTKEVAEQVQLPEWFFFSQRSKFLCTNSAGKTKVCVYQGGCGTGAVTRMIIFLAKEQVPVYKLCWKNKGMCVPRRLQNRSSYTNDCFFLKGVSSCVETFLEKQRFSPSTRLYTVSVILDMYICFTRFRSTYRNWVDIGLQGSDIPHR